ncbi:UDP-4-amino-4,6-dideoxy-N-acetyl-beta-L-altrosamine N-acetyltransferase [Francisella marina]|uniref:UDP-4-amino-4, 6-dideoxy-N-acetyl-beta-L-altrosamine N-acetyltransferase n=1 Tax=Francisella marina TaxID=2249302 RepID=A0ABX5ZGM2_9GAMM|nr:UDP-4-amino-4,6-dideoxy-N-acetyl-beta-L-altrosamine N-acetyltransferase [Francisella marina]QEO57207.1 UDP-4-amino-4,6-dideoxy-N-acetyl-beta-L-altrosamine N-acetyltransferase [Francisella marina]QEO58678.1 UDP-4-amino-4,6-dideoxy-N-acetyl-beta-L-altrosamine N-acetyltransferase [Francisella marina]
MSEKVALINFYDTSLDEKKMILSWRNHSEIKKWMYNTHDISLADHLSFIEKLKEDDSKLYFLVKRGDNYLGVIDFYNFKNEEREGEYGLYANPLTTVPGVGRLLNSISIDYAFNVLKLKKLKLEVFETNVKVINLHRKFKFTEVSRKKVNNQLVICMELLSENREL